jgi:hypothetical protein
MASPYYPRKPPPAARRVPMAWIITAAVAGSVLFFALLATAMVTFVTPGGSDVSFELRPVLETTEPPCTDGALPAADGRACHRLADGMTVERVVEAKAELPAGMEEDWVVRVRLDEADAAAYRDLVAGLYPHDPPRNQVAIVMGDQVLSTVMFIGPITGERLDIGGFTRDSATELARRLAGQPAS